MFQVAVRTDNKVLIDNKSKFVAVHSSSGFKHSLKGDHRNTECLVLGDSSSL